MATTFKIGGQQEDDSKLLAAYNRLGIKKPYKSAINDFLVGPRIKAEAANGQQQKSKRTK